MIRIASTDPTPEELEAALSHPDAAFEIVDGEIVEKPRMSIFAYLIASRLRGVLEDFLVASGLGIAVCEWVFVLDAARPLSRKPDVAFISFERWPEDREVPERGDWEVVPDLAIEVLSPGDLNRKTAKKIREDFRYGVRQVWIIQPETRQVLVYATPKRIDIFDEDDTLAGGAILPGFRMPVADLFRRTVGR